MNLQKTLNGIMNTIQGNQPQVQPQPQPQTQESNEVKPF